MTRDLLLKGFEVELFTGTFSGKHIGVSSSASEALNGFVKEPDQRNLEYITLPERNYKYIKQALLTPRKQLREWLKPKCLTILPGSTLSLGDSKTFERSDPSNSYHSLIEKNYGTNVVTTSIHINLGIEDLSHLFAAIRLVRCEAALFLALSASSPFLDGSKTGVHSQRWIQFPLTPKSVPLFLNHQHYVKWVVDQLSRNIMWNERHLWTSVRPNGPLRPDKVDRLELRVCDLITDCDLLISITALLELRVLKLADNLKKLDPLEASTLNASQLVDLSDHNDIAAAKYSLDAILNHWRNGQKIRCRDWIKLLIEEVRPLAEDYGILPLLQPLHGVLEQGNQSMKWLKSYSQGHSIESVLTASIEEMELEEKSFHPYEAFTDD